MSSGIFLAGTGTSVGKSYAAAFFIACMKKTKGKILYYKPIQCGQPGDTAFIKKTVKHKHAECTYNLKTPSSPRFAFAKEKVKFNKKLVKDFLANAKKQYHFIIVEGAGGVRVPIAKNFDMADLAKLSGFPVVLVASPNLGTINHTLLSIDYLKSKKVKMKGFIFSWAEGADFSNEIILDSAQTIEEISGVPFRGSLPKLD